MSFVRDTYKRLKHRLFIMFKFFFFFFFNNPLIFWWTELLYSTHLFYSVFSEMIICWIHFHFYMKKKGFIDTNWFSMRIGSAILNGKRHHTLSTLLVIPLPDIHFISTLWFQDLFRQKLLEKGKQKMTQKMFQFCQAR